MIHPEEFPNQANEISYVPSVETVRAVSLDIGSTALLETPNSSNEVVETSEISETFDLMSSISPINTHSGPGALFPVPTTSINNELATQSQKLPSTDTNYKRKCVEMSCIISNKSLKIGKLQEDNDTLKRTVQLFNPDLGLEENDLKEIGKITEAKHGDMTFVRTVIMKMYKNDLERLEQKSLKGKKARPFKKKDGTVVHKEQKNPLTPLKLEKIRCLYGKRVGLDEPRFNAFNRHILFRKIFYYK